MLVLSDYWNVFIYMLTSGLLFSLSLNLPEIFINLELFFIKLFFFFFNNFVNIEIFLSIYCDMS